ncbi:cation:proton antiporter [Pleurocapsales cyanobacterium LEGE 06147]|nr:cation:proton antiporter [Pleurocapsales cyanobacterium LEGE 06147]
MVETLQSLPLVVLLVGTLLTLAILSKSGMARIGLPALVGYLVLGFLMRLADSQWQILSTQGQEIFEFLAEIGIISLLFRVGLESDLEGLLSQLSRASLIWIGNVLLSGGLGFVTAYFWLQLGLVTSLFIAIAMTATSVGVSIGVWQEEEATDSENGELLLDVAEMDDISGVILMALLFAVAPVLQETGISSILSVLAKTTGEFFLKAIVFGACCYFFSRYIEEKLTKFFNQIEQPPDPMLEVAGIGFIIAAIAGLLGFSVAIGAFFAGLLFSRDPEAVKLDASFQSIYELFVPFFFIGIGLKIAPNALISGLRVGAILLIAAIVGKLIGAAIPALFTVNCQGAILLGVSLIPRAEITFIVMQRGLSLGDWAVPSNIFAAMVVVSTITSIGAPITLRWLLHKWPQTREEAISKG